MHTPDFPRRFVRYAHYTLGKAGDAGVRHPHLINLICIEV